MCVCSESAGCKPNATTIILQNSVKLLQMSVKAETPKLGVSAHIKTLRHCASAFTLFLTDY